MKEPETCTLIAWPKVWVKMNLKLNWKRPLFYCLLPVFLVLAFVGFPPPLAPLARIKPSQEQSVPAEKKNKSQA